MDLLEEFVLLQKEYNENKINIDELVDFGYYMENYYPIYECEIDNPVIKKLNLLEDKLAEKNKCYVTHYIYISKYNNTIKLLPLLLNSINEIKLLENYYVQTIHNNKYKFKRNTKILILVSANIKCLRVSKNTEVYNFASNIKYVYPYSYNIIQCGGLLSEDCDCEITIFRSLIYYLNCF